MYTEVIKVGSEKDENGEDVGHSDALPISMMHDSPRPHSPHQHRACFSWDGFLCATD